MTYSQLSHNAREIVAKFTLATSQEVQLGVDWYPSALDIANRIAVKYGVSAETAAGVIAALSPNNRWERNIVDAENIIKCWAAGGTRSDLLAVKVCTYGKMKEKAIDILTTPIGVKLRAQIKTDYRDATAFINEELSEHFTPADIQAITWVTHKRIHNV